MDYGNWCGKGNSGKKPIDVLDEQCKKHDKCYELNGQWNSECDKQLVWNIAKNFGAINKIGWHARTYAVAAIVLFAGKVGGTALLKQQFPALAPFLP
ncbi:MULTISPECIES: phospholipase A2 family protein [Enterococcus]|uniref:phospholipase A2 family protein n=1 Tax=Enterococcus TaxID=1350 RepID=UPI001D0EB93C|nr:MULTISPECIES: phospholipase A2 family protein [Enterococcus]